MKNNINKIKEKPSLSWSLIDYQTIGEEPPQCVYFGQTEGQVLTQEDIVAWAEEEIKSLSVIKESYPEKFDEQYKYFILDLEYLHSLDKITDNELEKLADKGNFNFGQE